MADFVDSEAEESENEEEIDDDVGPIRHRVHKKTLALDSDEEEEDDDGEEVNDLIDDNPIEEDSDNESDRSRKRKKSDDEEDDLDDRLDDEDYELIEDNLGVKFKKKRRRIVQDADSDDEGGQDVGDDRETASQLFDGSDNEDERPSGRGGGGDRDYGSDESEGGDSEGDDFIVDDDDRPLTEKRKKKKPIFADSTLQEAQDIFGVDFDYDDFEKYEDQYYDEDEEEEEDEEDEYEDDDEQRTTKRAAKKLTKKKHKPKSIYEIYEPSELERAGFTDEDSKIRSQDVPERMQLRVVPVTVGTEEELEEEAEWIYESVFKNRPKEDKVLKPIESEPQLGDVTAPVAASNANWDDNDDWDTPTQPVSRPAPAAAAPAPVPMDDDDDDWDAPAVNKLPMDPPPAPAKAPQPVAADDEDWDTQTAVTAVTSVVPSSIVNYALSRTEVVMSTEEKRTSFVSKIKKALEFMRNQQLEVPFIAFYRKEYISPELDINDLWTIYREDARFCQLRARKLKVITLYENMQDYQAYLIMSKPDEPMSDSVRLISEDDMERLRNIQSHEELKDTYLQFSLYYAHDVEGMKEYQKKKKKELSKAARQPAEVDPDAPTQEIPVEPEEEIPEGDEPEQSSIKRKVVTGTYGLCRKMGLDTLAKKFGLPPDKLAQNMRDNYQKYEVEQYPEDPSDAAQEFISPRLSTVDEVLRAAKFMVSMQISREPLIRKTVREAFYERATIDIAPTKKGLKEIDENHPLYCMKYLKGKPIRDIHGDLFLKIATAEDDGLITVKISEVLSGMTSPNYIDEVKALYYKDEYTTNVQLWNDLRASAIVNALENHLYPVIRKELKAKLVADAKEHVLKTAAAKLRKWIEVKPYEPHFADLPEGEDEDWVTSRGIKVLAIAYVPDYSQVGFACLINQDGEASDYLRLANIMKSIKAFRETDRLEKEADLLALKNFIRMKKPHVVVIGGESRDAINIQEDVRNILNQLNTEDFFPTGINVEIIDNQLSKVYANSIKGMNDFRDYPDLLRQAVSLGRRMQDALIEFSQLCTPDDEILCLRYHPLQDLVPKEELLEYLQLEFVNRVNEVGVDVNRGIAFPYTSNLLQFVCGLGPRKALQLIKVLKQNNHRLENRTQLITLCHMGPKIWINCSGFIKIDTNSLGDSTEAYVEVLDSSRVHPETYEWARKMGMDALDYDDEDANPATALEEILDAPERLQDLDLKAFATELARQGFGAKETTLNDIRNEMNVKGQMYKDFRIEYKPPTHEELFNMLTKETPETLYIGKLVVASVIGITHKKPQGEQLDNAVPIRNEESGMWQCSFCFKNDFPDLSEVWNHFDANACPGQAVGIRVRLDNGITGFIPISKLSDKEVTNPDDRVKRNMSIHCRVCRIDVERFNVECTSRTSDLVDARNEWRLPKDPYYDYDAEESLQRREEEMKQVKQRMTYVKRVIIHPSFRNIGFREAEKLMNTMDQGEVIIRPSSKGSDHLTVTWKVCDNIYQHIDVREEGKENAFSLGHSLWIGNEEFEDLDEIIARHINPMASYCRDLLNYKYFKGFESRQAVDEYLLKERERTANKIHYLIYPSKEYPGKFLIAYLPKDKVRHEFITLRPEGYRFRQQSFESLNAVLKWFKEHYKDPPPNLTPVATNAGIPLRTPFATPGNNADARSVVGGPAASVYTQLGNHTTTPAQGQAYTPYSAYASHTPYTPTAQTPYMTPYQQSTVGYPTTPATMGAPPPQMTPGFAHPGVVPGTPGVVVPPPPRSSHHLHHSSRIPQPPRSIANSTAASEVGDWRKAAEAWAKSQQKTVGYSYNRQDGYETGNRTPATRNAAQIISDGIEKTRQMSNAAHHYIPHHHKSPRGGRDSLKSTPKTNFSPRSMIESSLGDETPLFDEH